MTTDDAAEAFFPEFPALARCLLVDASFRSRKDIVGALKASTMFEEIIEGKSLTDAIEQLSGRQFDALFLGPSIQIEKLDSFFAQASKVTMAKDCAFVSVFRDALGSSPFVQNTAAHIAVSDKASKQLFTESIVRAVLLASENSPWPGVRLEDDGTMSISEDGVWKKIGSDSSLVRVGGAAKKKEPENGLSALLTSGVLGILADACGEEVKANTQEELSRLLGKILAADGVPDAAGTEEDTAATKRAADTRRVVQEWALDKDYMGLNEASKVLKRKLISLEKDS